MPRISVNVRAFCFMPTVLHFLRLLHNLSSDHIRTLLVLFVFSLVAVWYFLFRFVFFQFLLLLVYLRQERGCLTVLGSASCSGNATFTQCSSRHPVLPPGRDPWPRWCA